MMPRRSLFVVSTILVSVLAGCQGRAPHMIAASGDRALAKEDYAKAEAEYAQVVEAQPWNGRARLQYGKALLGVGNNRGAREQLEKAYTLLPKDGEVISNLAEAQARVGDLEGAIRLLKSVAEDRRSPDDWLRLGRFTQRAKDYDTAETALLTAARGDGGARADTQMALYSFYDEIGRDEEALERLAMALWLEPQNPQIQELIRARGHEPTAAFAVRPIEQGGRTIPAPTVPFSGESRSPR
ncbi:MAG: tetratricopeptide repeat protein [Planctomycetota bacterium]|nr:tetratricopeptide repeat protein [Planctomycetota bacterium]